MHFSNTIQNLNNETYRKGWMLICKILKTSENGHEFSRAIQKWI